MERLTQNSFWTAWLGSGQTFWCQQFQGSAQCNLLRFRIQVYIYICIYNNISNNIIYSTCIYIYNSKRGAAQNPRNHLRPDRFLLLLAFLSSTTLAYLVHGFDIRSGLFRSGQGVEAICLGPSIACHSCLHVIAMHQLNEKDLVTPAAPRVGKKALSSHDQQWTRRQGKPPHSRTVRVVDEDWRSTRQIFLKERQNFGWKTTQEPTAYYLLLF